MVLKRRNSLRRSRTPVQYRAGSQLNHGRCGYLLLRPQIVVHPRQFEQIETRAIWLNTPRAIIKLIDGNF